MTDASKHRDSYVKVENYGDDHAECLVIEIGSFCLNVAWTDAEICAAAINAKIDEAVEARDAQWERAVKPTVAAWLPGLSDAYAEAIMVTIRRRLDDEAKPKDYAEARQRLRDAGADRWDHQTLDPITDHDAGDEHR